MLSMNSIKLKHYSQKLFTAMFTNFLQDFISVHIRNTQQHNSEKSKLCRTVKTCLCIQIINEPVN